MGWETLSIHSDSPSAAGLAHLADGTPVLHVPIAYMATPPAGDAKRLIFLEIFRVLKRFTKPFLDERMWATGSNSEHPRKGGGQALVQEGSAAPTTAFYLLDLLEHLLQEIAEPTVLARCTRIQLRHDYLDLRQMGKYLHLALYQHDGSPVFEGMPFPGMAVKESSTDLIGLAAWLGRDLSRYFYQNELADAFEHDVANGLDIAADAFAATFLEQDMKCVIEDKKSASKVYEALHRVENATPFKPPKFDDLAETIEKLLTLSIEKNGQMFGIADFYNVWESLCLDFAIRHYGPARIFTCDTQFLVWRSPWLRHKKRWADAAGKTFDKNAVARRPDLVLGPADPGDQWTIVDFKYYTVDTIKAFHLTCGRGVTAEDEKLVPKHERDLTSAEIYRMLLANYLRTIQIDADHENIRVEFWIPGLEASDPMPIFLHSTGSAFSRLYYRTVPIRELSRRFVDE